MATSKEYLKKVLSHLQAGQTAEDLVKKLTPLPQAEIDALDHQNYPSGATDEDRDARLEFLKEKGHELDYVTGKKAFHDTAALAGNIENFIGMTQIPIGLAGPLLINGTAANGDYFIPLATSEGALVASYNRGMKACRLSGGVTTVCLMEGVQRSPFFKFDSITTVGPFAIWVDQHFEKFQEIVSQSSRFAKLQDMRLNIEGNSVILTFEYWTGDAAGQNMVTICTDKICKYILSNFPKKPIEWYIESNYAGDKKATMTSFSGVRGKKVSAEVVLKKDVIKKVLKSTPEAIAKYLTSSTFAVIQSGSIGAQGHVANGLTALFLACGQDAACISEASIGITRMEVIESGDLYVSVTLPSLIVGTVGGGTGLPTQKECLSMIDCAGAGNAAKFAEICCAVALAGEISIASAMSADHFTSAHENLGRKK